MSSFSSTIARITALFVGASKFFNNDDGTVKLKDNGRSVTLPSEVTKKAETVLKRLAIPIQVFPRAQWTNLATCTFTDDNKDAILETAGFLGYCAFVQEFVAGFELTTASQMLCAAALECNDNESIDWMTMTSDFGTLANLKVDCFKTAKPSRGNTMKSSFSGGDTVQKDPAGHTLVNGFPFPYKKKPDLTTRSTKNSIDDYVRDENVFELPETKVDPTSFKVIKQDDYEPEIYVCSDLSSRFHLLLKQLEAYSELEYTTARAEANPYEYVGDKIFSCRSGMKLVNLIKTLDIKNVTTFLDLCSAPGSFSEVLLSMFPGSRGFASTIKGECYIRPNSLLRKSDRIQILEGVEDDDITKEVVQDALLGFVGKVDFVCSDGGFEADPEHQEQDHIILKMCEIGIAIKALAPRGSAIVKTFALHTDSMASVLAIASSAFLRTSIIKPVTSRASCLERYIYFEGKLDSEAGDVLLSTANLMKEAKMQGVKHTWIEGEIDAGFVDELFVVNNEILAATNEAFERVINAIFDPSKASRKSLQTEVRIAYDKRWNLEKVSNDYKNLRQTKSSLGPVQSDESSAPTPVVHPPLQPTLPQLLPFTGERLVPCVFDGVLNYTCHGYSSAVVKGSVDSWVSKSKLIQIIRLREGEMWEGRSIWFLSPSAALILRGNAELTVVVPYMDPVANTWLRGWAPGFKPVVDVIGDPMSADHAMNAIHVTWLNPLIADVLRLQSREDFNLATLDTEEFASYRDCASKMKKLALSSKIILNSSGIVYPCGSSGSHLCTISLFQSGAVSREKAEHPDKCTCHKIYNTKTLRDFCAEFTHTGTHVAVADRTGAVEQRRVTPRATEDKKKAFALALKRRQARR
jgi:23S rRNA U2552 (ribose-2'-O)-methylase RlmE/FtsJ